MLLRRLSASACLLLLVIAMLAVGETPSAQAATGTSPSNGSVNNQLFPQYSGTGTPGNTIKVKRNNPPLVNYLCAETSTYTVAPDGSWSCGQSFSFQPADSVHQVNWVVEEYSPDGLTLLSTSPLYSYTNDREAPRAPTFGQVPTTFEHDDVPAFSGGGEDGATVTVSHQGGAAICSGTASGGTWSCSAGAPFAPGQYTIEARQVDPAGNTSTWSIPNSFTVNAPPTVPAPSINTPATIENDDFPAFSGTAEPHHSVTVWEASAVVCTASADQTGNWSCTAASQYSTGTYTVTATQTDGSTTSSASQPVTLTVNAPAPPPAPVLDAPGTIAHDATPSFAGTGEPLGTVAVSINGGPALCTGGVDQGGSWSCSASGPLAPGTHDVVAQLTDSGGTLSPLSTVRTLSVAPEAPVLAQPTSPIDHDASATFTGTGHLGATVTVTVGGATACTAQVTQAGWSCTSNAPSPGTHALWATQAVDGVVSPASASLGLTVSPVPAPAPSPTPVPSPAPTGPAPTPAPSPAPAPSPQPIPWNFTLGTGGSIAAGDSVSLRGSGLPAGSIVVIELHSTPRTLGSTSIGADGVLRFTAPIPSDVEPGSHTVVATLTPPGGVASTATSLIEVAAAPAADEPASAEEPAADEAGDDDEIVPVIAAAYPDQETEYVPGMRVVRPQLPRTEPTAQTAITEAVPTAVEVVLNPTTVATAGGVAIAVMLLAALPTEILNSTLQSNTGRFGRFFRRMDTATNRATAWLTRISRSSAAPAIVLIAATAVIFAFTDAELGFDIPSLRLVLSLGLALFLVTWVASRVSSLFIDRRWGIRSTILLQPAALVFALIGVVLARLLEFSPGFLIGLVIGLELAGQVRDEERIRAVLVQFGAITGISLLAWLGYSASIAVQGTAEPGFVSLLVQDTLAATVAEGLTAVAVGMLPIGFMDGKEIYDHSRRTWVCMFLVIGTLFALLVLPGELEGQQVGDYGTWLLVLVGYCAVTLGLWYTLKVTAPLDNDATTELERIG